MKVIQTLLAALRWLAYLIFWLGLGIGVYVRYHHLPESYWLLWTAGVTAGITLLVLLLTFRYTGRILILMNKLTLSFNPAFLLGCLAFTRSEDVAKDNSELIMNLVLLSSLVTYTTWTVIVFGMSAPFLPSLIHSPELFSLAGIFSAVLITSETSSIGVFGSLLFIGFTIFTLYRKNLFVLLLLPLLLILNIKTILVDVDVINKESLIIFILILLVRPFASVFASTETALDSWQSIFDLPLLVLRVVALFSIIMEIALLLLTGHSLKTHKEWWVVMPLFTASALILWLPLHFVYLIVHWKLWGMMRKAMDLLNSDRSRSLTHILSSKGAARHFSIISYPLMWYNLVITFSQFVLSWTTQNSVTSGLLLFCLPMQLVVVGLLRILANQLGGTCCGYALVTPSVLRSKDDMNMREVQASSSYATRTIRLVQEFFTHHLLADGGCEYLSDRMTESSLKEKLDTFFNTKTQTGVNFDSYLLYYSGPVSDSGDWLLKGDGILSYATLITWWTDLEVSKTSRLILVLDTAKSNFWVSHVRRTVTACVGIQTLYVRREAEAFQEFCIGDFSRDWIDFNCNKESHVYSNEFVSPIITTFGVSAYWASFRFHKPTTEEIEQQWLENFSIRMKPLLKLYSLCDTRFIFCCLCSAVSRWIALLRLWLWPPNQLDIGHGFKLVRFNRLPDGSGFL